MLTLRAIKNKNKNRQQARFGPWLWSAQACSVWTESFTSDKVFKLEGWSAAYNSSSTAEVGKGPV